MAEPTTLEYDTQLDADIFHLYQVGWIIHARLHLPNARQTTRPSAAVLAARDSFLARLTTAIRSRYGAQYTVALFGSTAYGVSGAGSDLDVSVVRLFVSHAVSSFTKYRLTATGRMGLLRKWT
jgi:hypothetical protein